MKEPDTVFWLRAVGYLAVFGVFLGLVIEDARPLPAIAAAMALFVLLMPSHPWTARLPPGWFFALVLTEGALVTAGLFLTGQPTTVLVLFFVLIPACARLPRQFSLLCYVLFPLMTSLPFVLRSGGLANWAPLTIIVPGLLASIVFAEGYRHLRNKVEENQKLLDELIDAQRRLEPMGSAAEASGPFTRRDREVLDLVAKGFSNKEIAQRLFIAEGTVKNRVSVLLDKIGARDRTQAALRARELGLV